MLFNYSDNLVSGTLIFTWCSKPDWIVFKYFSVLIAVVRDPDFSFQGLLIVLIIFICYVDPVFRDEGNVPVRVSFIRGPLYLGNE